MSRNPELHVVILKADRLYGDFIRRQVWDVWPNAVVQVFQRGLEALAAVQDAKTDLFIAGAKIEDMDGLEHLEPFVETALPVLIVTSRADARMFEMLRHVRYDGIFDGPSEGLDHLPVAFRQVMQHRNYISPALLPFLQARRNTTLETLTEREQVVLSVIGDGSDNVQAGDRLGISQWTVLTHRENIMRKLDLHHSKEVMHYALLHGYVLITAKGVYRPGFQRRLDGRLTVPSVGGAKCVQRRSAKRRYATARDGFDS